MTCGGRTVPQASFVFRSPLCESIAVRAVALMGPYARQEHVRPFELPGVNIFCGNEFDPTDEPEAALVFGGDGTIHRHLGALALKHVPTLIVPIGSGNDFAQSIGVMSVAAALSAWKSFCSGAGNTRCIDLGTIQPVTTTSSEEGRSTSAAWRGETLESMHFVPDGPRRDLPQMGPRIMQSQLRRKTEAEQEAASTTLFCCIAGTGLDAAVNRRALEQPRWLRSHGGYVVALLKILPSFQPPRITLQLESENRWETFLDEKGFLLAAGNGPQYGDGMRIADRAQMNDGLLDVCLVRRLGKLRLLRLFPVVYKGRHIGMPEVEYFRTSRLRVLSDPKMEVFADGEFICQTPVEIGVRPDAFQIIAPAR